MQNRVYWIKHGTHTKKKILKKNRFFLIRSSRFRRNNVKRANLFLIVFAQYILYFTLRTVF